MEYNTEYCMYVQYICLCGCSAWEQPTYGALNVLVNVDECNLSYPGEVTVRRYATVTSLTGECSATGQKSPLHG